MDQSFNDLKFQLQQELQKEGMVENMKTQLRYKLLERLQMQQKKIPSSDKISESEMLLKRVLASAVADYLREAKLDYSLSVFVLNIKQKKYFQLIFYIECIFIVQIENTIY